MRGYFHTLIGIHVPSETVIGDTVIGLEGPSTFEGT